MTDPSFASRLKAALREHFDSIVKEPLPDKWLELIEQLRERDRKEVQARTGGKDSRKSQ
jgi:hypothetical protein